MADTDIPDLECVDAEIGERVLEAIRPGLDPDTRRRIEAHLEVCAFCRQTVDLEQKIAAAVREGFPAAAGHRRRSRRRPSWATAASLAAAAAAVVCMVALAPRPVGPKVTIRGPEDARFLRPVEGEVVLRSSLAARWTEVPGADSYEVLLSEVDGPSSWTASTTETHWETPPGIDLSDGDRYRLVLATVPSDLLAPGSVSVRFRVGGIEDLVRHRLSRAQPITYGLLAAALLLGVYAVLIRRGA